MRINLNKQLTQNFKLGEFINSKFYNSDQQKKVIEKVTWTILQNIHDLADNLQVLRNELNTPININIAFRPVWWELEKGRSGESQHTKGKAADIKVSGYTPQQVSETIERLINAGKMKQGGLSTYNTFTHYDHRGQMARW